MTYDYDEAVAIPMVLMYDTDMMKMYLSAAKEEYERALADLDKFAKEFGDLYSPSSNLNKAYYDATKGAVNLAMDYLYKNGIDPVRSAEGRAYIQKIIRERPYAEIANMRAQSESMKAYQKYRAEAMRNGTYDPDFEKFVLGGKSLETWDPTTDGMWTREAPSKYSSIKDWTSNLFDNMDYEYDDALTREKGGGLYEYYSKSADKMSLILDANAKDLMKSDLGRYYLNMYGGDINALKADIINRNREYTAQKRQADQVAVHLNDQRFQEQLADKQFARQVQLAKMLHQWNMEEAYAKEAAKQQRAANGKNSTNYSLVGDVTDLATNTYQNFFAVNNFGLKNYGNNVGYFMRAQHSAFKNKDFDYSHLTFNLPRGGYEAWTGAHPKKGNSSYGYSFNKNEIKGKVLTDLELRQKGAGIKNNKLWFDLIGSLITGITPQESDNNGISIMGKDGKLHIYQKVNVYTFDGTYIDNSGEKYKRVGDKYVNINTNKEISISNENKAALANIKKNTKSYTAWQELPAGDVGHTLIYSNLKNRGNLIPNTNLYQNGGSMYPTVSDINKNSSKWTNINKTYNGNYIK